MILGLNRLTTLVFVLMTLCSVSYAAMSVEVSGISSGGDLLFGTIDPGDQNWNLPEAYTESNNTPYVGITVICRNPDAAQDWTLQVTGLQLTSGSETIPLANFMWLPTYAQFYDGSNTNNNQSATTSSGNSDMMANFGATNWSTFTGSPQIVYSSNSGDDDNYHPSGQETQIKVQFAVIVPGSLPPGEYTANLTFEID